MNEININNDQLEELERLEIRQKVSSELYSYPKLSNCDRMLIRWMSGIMIRSSNAEESIIAWRNLINRNHRTENDFTETQLREINIDDDEIVYLYNRIQEILMNSKLGLKEELIDRITHKYGHYWNDEYEQRQKPKRSLQQLNEKGILISIPLEYLDLIRKNFIEGAECPILDKVKNMRIVTINGFEGSKMSLTIHDIFDHFWFYSRLESLGILDRYSSFLQKVGNPQDTDIFKREGELIASVSFDYRGYTVSEKAFKPLFNFEQILKILKKLQLRGIASQNQLNALAILNDLDQTSDEANGLCYILSGLSIELMEQRRKHGYIRTLDQDNNVDGILPILDPEYVALVIESNSVLFDKKEKANDVLLNISVIVEDYLIRLANGQVVEDLIIKTKDLENFNPENSVLSEERIEWIRENIGFAANRRDQC